MTHAANDWIANSRDQAYLFDGTRLDIAERWANERKPSELNQTERAFLDASNSNRRTKKIVGWLFIGIAAIALIAVSSGVWLSRIATKERQTATALGLFRDSILSQETFPERSLLLAVEAARVSGSQDAPTTREVAKLLKAQFREVGGERHGQIVELQSWLGCLIQGSQT